MGTRGIYGVVAGRKEKISYNHYDSYPEGLGLNVLGAGRRIQSDFDNYLVKAKKLKLVSDDRPPTPSQVKKLERFANTTVSTQKVTEWYVLLRELQGDLLGHLDCGFMSDSSKFAQDSLFCEWGWVVNMDDRVLECYRGFVKSMDPPPLGRFVKELKTDPDYPGGSVYQPIHLLGQFPMDDLPDDATFIAQTKDWYDASCSYFGENPMYAIEEEVEA
jgi:hypothetical protein